MLIEQIKADQLVARKAGDKLKATTLTTLIGEAEMIGKNDGNRMSSDSEVIKVINKFVKGIDETLSLLKVDSEAAHDKEMDLINERITLIMYLPKLMSEAELKNKIDDLVNTLPEKSPKMMGKIMAELKAGWDGLYDGKLASQLVKERLI